MPDSGHGGTQLVTISAESGGAPKLEATSSSTTPLAKIPPKNLSVQLGKAVDLLQEARPMLGAGIVQTRQQLFTRDMGGLSQMAFSGYEPRGEYLLDAVVTRTKGKDGIIFGIVVDGMPCTAALDCFVEEGRGAHSGLELINGQRLTAAGYPAVHKGEVLKNGQRARVQVAVRKGNVVLQVDGRVLVDWKGDSSKLSRVPVTLSGAGPRVAIGTWKSDYTIESVRVYPIVSSGGVELATLNTASSKPGSEAPELKPSAPSPPQAEEPKSPPPDDAALAKAREKLKETFGDFERKGKKPEEKLKLAREFVTVAASEKDPAVRYALLDASRRLAMGGQNVAVALDAALQIERRYDVDPLEQQLQTLKLATGTLMPPSTWEEAAEVAVTLAKNGQTLGREEIADGASLLAVEFAAKGKNLEQRKLVKQVRDTVIAFRKSAGLVKEAEETLKTNPADPAANLIVGKWCCFVLDDQTKGLACLEKCGEPVLAKAAQTEKDQKANSLAKGDAWYEAAAGLQREEKLAALRIARNHYTAAARTSTGLEKLRAARRESDLAKELGE